LAIPGNDGGSVTIRNDGGFAGNEYARLYSVGSAFFGPVIGQLYRAIAGGVPTYFACAVRSSNNPGTIFIQLDWIRRDGTVISPSNIISVTGQVSNWTFPSLNGTLTPPTDSAYVNVSIYVQSPAGEYWDIDYVILQQVVNQTSTSDLTSLNTSNAGLTARSVATTIAASYTKLGVTLIGPDGTNVLIGSAGGVNNAFSGIIAPSGLVTGVISVGDSTRMAMIVENNTGVTESLATAIANGRQVKGGIITP
jgi:hypothetical protein